MRTVAVFSEADRDSMHVRQADEAFCVGPAAASRSYLNIPNIISTALILGCDAVHPGYGFLAENARFAEICADHGLVFIGPRPSVIAAMGDKATAKAVMRDAGVATTPGTDILPSVRAAAEAAEAIGYPVLLKATAGGGGKGMRVVERPADLERAFASATAEAEASFKDGRVYLEKLISNPRHIEVQVLGDAAGNVVHLGERDCSVQKPSHQKLIEESPAPNLSARARSSLHAMAVRACQHVGYTNAGTLEFLASGDDVYFMEMNTRIQVEHPVTEMVFGIDLVKEQIRIATGEALGYVQRDLVARGHAVECRINAEDPRNNFAPQAGVISNVVFAGGTRNPGGHAPVCGRDDPTLLRLDAGEGRCLRRYPRDRNLPLGARARRNGRRRRAHDDRALPGDLGFTAVSFGPLRRRIVAGDARFGGLTWRPGG